ncbi:Semaphorin-6A [Cichlidogyrus casuarinus]|uniref:Semaphorin-6A n=1 Tax=Cichlidogyrus casuarinus TaxID=1844966 RepID=A0ABD2PWU8_9PLAT
MTLVVLGIVFLFSVPGTAEEFISDLLTNGYGKSLLHPTLGNFTDLIEVANDQSLYIVSSGSALLKVHAHSMQIDSSIQLDHRGSQPECQSKCQQRRVINLLETTPDKQNIWFCYVLHTYFLTAGDFLVPAAKPNLARCEVPNLINFQTAGIVFEWNNDHYSSHDINRKSLVILGSDGFVYSAGWFDGSPKITRSYLPFLQENIPPRTTPQNNQFLKEPAEFVEMFESVDAVYIIVQEICTSSCNLGPFGLDPDIERDPLNSPTEYTCTQIIRICKGDRSKDRENVFVTMAKARMVCPSEPGSRFKYTIAVTATWEPIDQRLYMVFVSESNSPDSAALCVFDLPSIEKVFRGPFAVPGRFGQASVLNDFPYIVSAP